MREPAVVGIGGETDVPDRLDESPAGESVETTDGFSVDRPSGAAA